MDDSGDDLFITQSSFCCLDDTDTQAVDEAAENVLDTSFDLLDNLPKGDIVEYWDFSHEHEGKHANVQPAKEEAFVPLLPDLMDDKVCFSSYFPAHLFVLINLMLCNCGLVYYSHIAVYVYLG